MQKLLLAAATVIIWTAAAFAQLEVTHEPATAIHNVSNPRVVGDLILVDASDKLRYAKVSVVTVDTSAANVEVTASDASRLPVRIVRADGSTYILTQPGKTWVEVLAVDFPKNIFTRKTIVVDVGKTPTPDPDVDPDPPNPDDPAPIPLPGLRVLFVYESADVSRLTVDQLEIIRGGRMAEFLNDNCVPDGWRVLDQHTKFTDASYHWAKAINRERASIPWMLVSNGVTGYEGPLPANVNDAIQIIEGFKL